MHKSETKEAFVKEAVFPAVCVDGEGRVVGAVLQNEKARDKSLEQKEVWMVHPATGRVVPAGMGPVVRVVQEEGWVRVVVRGEGRGEVREEEGVVRGDEGGVLERLEGVVRARRSAMPEGSYTTHLFSSGGEKIRKKTGEEAIELLLAPSRERIVYEAADFLYHLMVLLVWEGIAFRDVLEELSRRFDR